jgi:hypothetical protein
MTDKLTLKEIHNKYINELLSLDRTCIWLEEEYGIKTNRQRLSKDFKRRGYAVFLPNGWSLEETLWRDMSVFYDETSQLVGKLVQTAWEDILKPELRIHYLSAAAFLASDFYESCLATLMRNVRSLSVGHELLPEGIKLDDIIAGNSIYSRNYSYWVDN